MRDKEREQLIDERKRDYANSDFRVRASGDIGSVAMSAESKRLRRANAGLVLKLMREEVDAFLPHLDVRRQNGMVDYGGMIPSKTERNERHRNPRYTGGAWLVRRTSQVLQRYTSAGHGVDAGSQAGDSVTVSSSGTGITADGRLFTYSGATASYRRTFYKDPVVSIHPASCDFTKKFVINLSELPESIHPETLPDIVANLRAELADYVAVPGQ